MEAKRPGASATFKKCAVVTLTSQRFEECGAAPTTGIFGVALDGCSAGEPDPPGTTVSVAKADRVQAFASSLTNGSDTPVNVTLSHDGIAVGVRKMADGRWTWDQAATACGRIIQVQADLDLVIGKFNEAALQQP